MFLIYMCLLFKMFAISQMLWHMSIVPSYLGDYKAGESLEPKEVKANLGNRTRPYLFKKKKSGYQVEYGDTPRLHFHPVLINKVPN